jgi:two-component system sensor histidine kinase UhpB
VVSPPSVADRRRLSLLWWVFFANGAVLFVVFLLLSFSPIEISAPIELGQFALLVAGLAAMLALSVLLLRRVLSPFFRLTETMGAIDPERPGQRLSGVDPRTSEGAALVDAFNAMLDRLESARRESARTALAAQEAERSRVARELHDEIGQTLTAVMLQAERAADSDPTIAQAELVRVADAVRESLDEVRRIARELRPEALDDLGLVNALIALCSQMEDQGGTRVRRQLQGKLPPLSPEIELVIYRIAQESLTNALRHARARVVNLSLAANTEGVTLAVSDDGRGMASEPVPGTAGISGMRERAMLVGGRLSIASGEGQGTEVMLTVPLDIEDQ